jgi:hypothetical protein
MLGAWLEAVLLQQFCSSVAACVHCVLLTVNVVSGVSIYRVLCFVRFGDRMRFGMFGIRGAAAVSGVHLLKVGARGVMG